MHRSKVLALTFTLACGIVLAAAAPAFAGSGHGAVYTLTNSASGNAVAVFDRDADGNLAPDESVATGGAGSGADLGSQGALVLEGRRLFAVNAGSNTISTLRVGPSRRPRLTDVEASRGVAPISVTVHGGLLYVLNSGDATHPANIHGFVVLGGKLVSLPGSTRALSAAAPGPAQIEFSPNGRQLVVTEKGTNRIVSYQVNFLGFASGPNAQPSAGQTPFGFAFDAQGRLIVSEAFGGAPDASVMSSYSLASNGTISPIDPNVATTETAACWVVVTPDGRFAYTTNTGSGSISGFAIGANGSLTLLDPDGKTATVGAGPVDAAIADGGRFLYVLSSGSHEITGFEIQSAGGSLVPVGAVGGLPPGAAGLAAS
jgi:DNA-binding beta-propeller fold protein YncE